MLNASVKNGHWMPYKREETLEKYHYKNNNRISPILGIAEDVIYIFYTFYFFLKKKKI